MALIYKGKEIPTPGVTVIDWHTHGLTWALGTSGTRKRTVPLTQFVSHWVASENPAKSVYHTLSARGLSVQLFLAADGTVYQYVDLDTVCSHAGHPTNDRSIGIEQQSVGHGPPNAKVTRDRIPDTVHGTTRPTSQFTQAQIDAFKALRLAIAHIIPIDTLPDTTVVPLSIRNKFVGDLGHYQISLRKRDPGTHHMARIAALKKHAG